MNCKHIVGPPGCGKTHACMRNIESLLNAGFRPEEIAFVSFTKAAITEARNRVQERFGFSRDEIPYFGTIHSLAYRSIGLGREDVLSISKWAKFCEELHIDFSSYDGKDDEEILEPIGTREGDIFKRFHDWRRNCKMGFDEAFTKFDTSPYECFTKSRTLWLTTKFEEYKNDNGLYDFTDMLLELQESGWYPPVKVLIVDETQDLSPLQKEIVLSWAEKINNLLMAYDGDQCIYDFQGADPKWLLEMGGTREFLTQSYRVPSGPSKIAQRVIAQNKERYNTTWNPRDAQGMVKFNMDLSRCIKLCSEAPNESWYFIGRNKLYLSSFVNALYEEGIPYTNLRGLSPKASIALITSLKLSLKEPVSAYELDHLADGTAQKDWWARGAKAAIGRMALEKSEKQIFLHNLEDHGALPELVNTLSDPSTCFRPLKMDLKKAHYFTNVYKRYGMDGLTSKPQVIVSTIHGVKGGGAQNVVINPEVTKRTYNSYVEKPEAERRVWYVGASRTENRLFVLEANSRTAYQDW